MTHNIIWEAWQDPLSPLVDGKPFLGNHPEEDERDPAFHRARATFRKPVGDPERLPRNGNSKRGHAGPAVVGPMGIIPLHECNIPSALFNFWMGHTDFDLTRTMVQTIAAVPGVETLDVFTRYRFRVGIGKAFDERKTRQHIDTVVQPPPAPVVVAKKPADPMTTIHSLLSKHPFWAIRTLEDGRYDYAVGQTKEEVLTKIGRLDGTAKETVLSWEKQ